MPGLKFKIATIKMSPTYYAKHDKLQGNMALEVLYLPLKNKPAAYKLYGIVEHVGHSSKSGHYKAHLLNEAGMWWSTSNTEYEP